MICASVNLLTSLFIILLSLTILSACLESDFMLQTITVTELPEIVFFYWEK